MGRILTVRVSAVTYDDGEVFRAWPDLCALAWPGQGEVSGRAWVPHIVSAALAALTLTLGMTSDLSLVTRRVTPAESRYFAILFYEFNDE